MKLANVNGLKETLMRTSSKILFKGKKYSPEILITAGILCSVGGFALAINATRKVDDILATHEDMKGDIQKALRMANDEDYPVEVDYDEEDARKDTIVTYAKTGFALTKLYGPALALEAVSVACILAGFGIIKKRNAALVVAYNGLQEAFEKYRKRIIEDFGDQYDEDVRRGVRRTTIKATEVGEDGKKHKVDQEVVTQHSSGPLSQYAKCFDAGSLFWKKNAELNLLFLRTQQNWANDVLRLQGHLFLNEVYSMLDIPHTQDGALVGWIYDKQHPTYVDFGIYNLENERSRRFVNGDEPNVWLDFNVQGLIFDKI